MIARLQQPSVPPNAVIAKERETEGKLQMRLSSRKNGPASLFKEVRVFKVFVLCALVRAC